MRTAPSWAGDPLTGHKFDRNAVEIPRYVKVERGFKAEGRAIVARLENGEISKAQFTRSYAAALKSSETEAFIAGRRARGNNSTEFNEAELKMLAGRHSRNMKYAHAFADDIESGKGRMNYGRRSDLYGDSLWSVYTRGETTDWDSPSMVNRFDWIMDPDAEHCNSCIERARRSRAQNGFTFDELIEIGFPGERTDCGPRCRCHVRERKARRVDPERAAAAEPARSPEAGIEEYQRLTGEDYSLTLPAAGVPGVKTAPSLIDQAGRQDSVAQLLPTVPRALTSPNAITVEGNLRFYGTDLFTAITERSELDGIWYLVGLLLKGILPQ